MAKKLIIGLVAVVVVAAVATLAWYNLAGTGTSEVIQITVNDHNPEMSGPAQAVAHWAKKVEEACEGRVKMNTHFGGVLLKGDEGYRGVQKGIVDAAVYVLDRKDGFLLNSFVTLPFMGWPNFRTTGDIYDQFLEKYPEMRSEWKDIKPLVFAMMPPTQIHNIKKIIRTPEDLKGMKFHGSEYAVVQILAAAGATPVQMDIADMYMSLDRGLIDGVMNHFPVLTVFGVLKIQNFHTIIGEGGINMTPMGIIWNEKSWNSLPADIQEKIESVNHEYTDFMYNMSDKMIVEAMENAKNWGHTVTYLTGDEKLAWYNLVKKPIHDKWIEEAEAKGLPAKAVYNEITEIIKKELM